MNTIQFLSAQPWIERLGWTLVHFLWQGVLIAAVYAAVRKWIVPSARPNIRYALACGALAVMAAAPLATWSLLGTAPSPAVAVSAHLAAAAAAPTRTIALEVPGVASALPERLLPWVVALWLAGAAAFWLRLLSSWIGTMRLRSQFVRPAPSEWQQAVDRLKARLRVSRPVRLLVSSLVQTPAVVGWLRPVVLVPIGALAGLPPEQVEALLLHELAHIRRHDYLVNIAQSVVEALLFYHPAVWWISGHIRTEREQCCDDVAVSVSGDVLTYVRALAELASARQARVAAAMAATGGSLSRRIARLLGETRPTSRAVSGPGTLATTILLAVTAIAVFGQPAARPKFEVAAIKPSLERRFISIRPLPGRLTANSPVRVLMQNAYTVQPFQIIGGPDWMGSDYYEIDAKPPGEASRAQMFLMLQSLLEDRFQLKIHRETKELPVYQLTTSRGGAKLASPKEGSCVPPVTGLVTDLRPGGRVQPPNPGQPPAAPCGAVNVMLAPAGARMMGGNVAMAEFTRVLSTALGRTVIDKTGFTAHFDVQLNFVPDETTAALPSPPPGAQPDGNNPSILVALQEQLGLRLESAKGPVDVIVVDGVERPTEN
jgi:uncharacterized protein (TIGR03435 family)